MDDKARSRLADQAMGNVLNTELDNLKRKASDLITHRKKNMIYHGHHMEAGGCGVKFWTAVYYCNPDLDRSRWIATEEDCTRATKALRRCMEADPDHFKFHLRNMQDGLAEDRRRGREAAAEEKLEPSEIRLKSWDEGDYRWKWWTGMRMS